MAHSIHRLAQAAKGGEVSAEQLAAMELEHRLALCEKQRDKLHAALDVAKEALSKYSEQENWGHKDEWVRMEIPNELAKKALKKIEDILK